MIKKSMIGKIIKVYFDDHCISYAPHDEIKCWAVGELESYDRKKIRLRFWFAKDGEKDSDNHEFVTILKSVIRRVRVMK